MRPMEPKSWQVLLAGGIVQLGVAVGILGSLIRAADRTGALAGWYLLAFVLLAVVVALLPFALMWYGRRRNIAAVLSVLIGIGFLAVNEFALETWVFPLFLFVAGALSWREGSTPLAPTADA